MKNILAVITLSLFIAGCAMVATCDQAGDTTSIVQHAIAAASDPSREVRFDVFMALSRVTDARVGPAMVKLLESKEPDVRSGAARVIAHNHYAKAAEPLKRLLQDPDLEVQRSVRSALVGIGYRGTDLIDLLKNELRHQDSCVRRNAALSLGQAGTDRAVDILAEAMYDVRPLPEPPKPLKIPGVIDFHVTAMTPEEAAKERVSRFRADAASALGDTHNPRAVPALIRALRCEDRALRLSTVMALGRTFTSEAVLPLIDALGDADVLVRRCAAESLGTIGDSRAIPSLKALLRDVFPGNRLYAADALARLKNGEADRAVLDALDDKSLDVNDMQSLLIGLGIPGSEAALIKALQVEVVNDDMLRTYAYSGNASLASAARKKWSEAYCGLTMRAPEIGAPKWGSRGLKSEN